MPDVTANATRAKCGQQNSHRWQSISYRFDAVALIILESVVVNMEIIL